MYSGLSVLFDKIELLSALLCGDLESAVSRYGNQSIGYVVAIVKSVPTNLAGFL